MVRLARSDRIAALLGGGGSKGNATGAFSDILPSGPQDVLATAYLQP